MISCIATNEQNDWYLTAYKSIAFVQDTKAANQAIRNVLQLWVKEWMFNRKTGVNYNNILSPSLINNETNLIDFNIRKIFQISNQSTTWYTAHENWNQYLKQNFNEEIYNKFQANLLQLDVTLKETNLQISIEISYGNNTNENIQLSIDLDKFTNLPYVENAIISSEENLRIQLFTPTNEKIEVGKLIVRNIGNPATGVGMIYTNFTAIYPASLINNMIYLSPWRTVDYDPFMETEYKILIPNTFKVIIP